MSKIFSLFFCLIGLFSFSCKTTQNAENTVKIPEDFSFSLKRTACHGQCPIYTYTILGDGMVYYTGEAFVKNVGRFQKRLDESTLKSIIKELEAVDYWELSEKYDEEKIMDLPSCETSCTMNGKSHTIINRFNGPEKLMNMEKKIDELVGEEGFASVKKKK